MRRTPLMHLATFVLTTLFSTAALADDPPCRVIENLRINHALEIQSLSDVCEVTGALAIFATDDLKQVYLPLLKRVGILNVESYELEDLNLPALEQVDQVSLEGPRLTLVELPSLRHVTRDLYIKAPRLENLNLLSLGTVGSLWLQNVPALNFAFVDNIYDIRRLEVRGAPKLDLNVRARLDMAAGVPETSEQAAADAQSDIAALQQQIRDLQRQLVLSQAQEPDMPPTGHPVAFGTIGQYYQAYPYYFYNYWNVLASRGWTAYYGPRIYWWWHN